MRGLSRAAMLLVFCACRAPHVDSAAEQHTAAAERFFRGVYGGDPSVVDELASDAIVLSYPVFAEVFGTPTLRGREACREFAAGFSKRWADPRIRIDEVVADGDCVVLVWSFQAKSVRASQSGESPADAERSWGGITLFRFDASGRIVAEVGEESDPGPTERTAANP